MVMEEHIKRLNLRKKENITSVYHLCSTRYSKYISYVLSNVLSYST